MDDASGNGVPGPEVLCGAFSSPHAGPEVKNHERMTQWPASIRRLLHGSILCAWLAWLATAAPAAVAAAEPVPLFELTYQPASPDACMPAALSGWWHASLAEVGTWCRQNMKTQMDPSAFLGRVRSCHLYAGGLRDGAALRPTLDCAWSGDALPEPMAAVVRSWPGQVLLSDAASASHGLRGPGYAAVPSLEHLPAGLHVIIDGRGIAADLRRSSWRAQVGLSEAMVTRLDSVISGWRCEGAVASGGLGWLDSGLPKAWFKPIPLADIRCIPTMSVGAIAIGIDGQRLAQAVSSSISSRDPPGESLLGLAESFLGIPVGMSLSQVAHACDGTWILCVLDDGSWILKIPRSPAMDDLLQGIGREHQLPADGACTQLQNGCTCACRPQAWLWSNQLSDIALWSPALPAPASALALDDSTSLWAFAHAPSAARFVDHLLGPSGALQFALPSSLCAPQVTREFAATLPDPRSPLWSSFIADLGRLPDLVLRTHAGGSTLRLDLDQGMSPWLLPALALRWCADYIQDRVGVERLQKTVTRLQALGESAITAETHGIRPALDDHRFQAARLMEALSENRRINRMESWRRYITYGAAAMGDDGSLQEARAAAELLSVSDMLDDPAFPSGFTIERLRSGARTTGGDLVYAPTAAAAQVLCNAGLTLIANGDRRGMVLLNRAERFMRRPQSAQDASLAWNIEVTHDLGYLLAQTRQLLEPAALQAFLHEDEHLTLTYWMGERVLACGNLARFLLGRTESLDAFYAPYLGSWQLLRQHAQWASTANDLASCMLAMQSCESDSFIVPSDLSGVSSQLGVALSLMIMKNQLALQFALAQRQLLHTAARIEYLALSGTVPKTRQELLRLIGPVQLAWGGTTRQLSYEALGEHGFHLFLEPTEGPPPGWSARAWEFMTVKPPPATTTAFIRHRGFSLTIDPGNARQPLEGANTGPSFRP